MALKKRKSAVKIQPLRADLRIEQGLPVTAIADIHKISGLSEGTVRQIARISPSSFSRRQKSGLLSPEESDRVYRLHRITKAALDFFEGDVSAAHQWLETPADALDGSKPVDLLINDAGVKCVEDLLIRLEHGVFT